MASAVRRGTAAEVKDWRAGASVDTALRQGLRAGSGHTWQGRSAFKRLRHGDSGASRRSSRPRPLDTSTGTTVDPSLARGATGTPSPSLAPTTTTQATLRKNR